MCIFIHTDGDLRTHRPRSALHLTPPTQHTHSFFINPQQEYSHLLGMGPQLARADLAIRGAGEVLGYEQSGDKGGDEIGYEAYMEMLAEALVKGALRAKCGLGGRGLGVMGLCVIYTYPIC